MSHPVWRLGWVGMVVVASVVLWSACDGQPAPTAIDSVRIAEIVPAQAPVPASGDDISAPAVPVDVGAPPPLTGGLTTWRGLVVAPEHRCSPYDADDYPYPQSVERRIVAGMGGIVYGPYTGTWFLGTRETDIEHIVARSEAHDSGLCGADAATKRRFAADVLNLTLANPAVNRSQKGANDAAEWLPALNQCWFADRVVQVRQAYGLTVDPRERDALDAILGSCVTTAMVVLDPQAVPLAPTAPAFPSGAGIDDALRLYDDNGNGRITCAEARRHGIAPVPAGHPAYPYMDDRDGDGVVCE
ncbi:MAG: excalibur calcium-binding domain-containing protein [Chloroflexota bacterium]|nr:excalibur calcium-binding domain-containing protein [Chloroflexota bacterium]